MATVNDNLRDAAIRHQIYLTRYSTGVVREMLAILNQTDQDIIKRLRNKALPGNRTPYQRERLQRMQREIRTIIASGQSEMSAALRLKLKEINAYEIGFATQSMNAAIVVDVEAVAPAAGTVYAAATQKPLQGKLLRDWFAGLAKNKADEVNRAIMIGITEGETVNDIIRRLRGTAAAKYRNGILSTSRRHAEAITRTAVNHVVTHARQSVFERNKDLVKGYQYVATLDGRTTDICMSLDGKMFESMQDAPTPPQHINCRSTIAPVMKSWKELGFSADELDPGTRASMNGQVSAKETYQTWLKKQGNTAAGRKFQDRVLGKTKAKLFREGNVTLDRFVDPTGRSYTLAELASREAEAWAAIGGG